MKNPSGVLYANTNLAAAWGGRLHHVHLRGFEPGVVRLWLLPAGTHYQLAERTNGDLVCWRLAGHPGGKGLQSGLVYDPEEVPHVPHYEAQLEPVHEPLLAELFARIYVMVRSRAENGRR